MPYLRNSVVHMGTRKRSCAQHAQHRWVSLRVQAQQARRVRMPPVISQVAVSDPTQVCSSNGFCGVGGCDACTPACCYAM
eukprot:CAMPEP_0183365290 /NCGR_PEP_ID=MMETSP0164_2-20130417/84163_1 /TAXON_ID=221442 /ORGANISM="Coccolithus pelagicus ssp braarudi, Strain PLY182g" /LENGTH=79 /DNA_ID=CAMNT_0025540793 /DNA_START=299 /DNA_END=538 /DNA_ORIENTATION=-